MFELDRAARAWCRAIHTNWWKRKERIAELEDHLYCEIEQLQEEGLSEEQAFLAATKRLGKAEELMKEHSKNNNFFFILWMQAKGVAGSRLNKLRHSMNPQKAAFLNIVVSLAVALAIIMSDCLLERSQYADYSFAVTIALVALYCVPFTLLSLAGAGEQGLIKSDYLGIKRKVAAILNRG